MTATWVLPRLAQLLTLFALVSFTACSTSSLPSSSDIQGFQDYLDGRIPELMERHAVPAVTVALIEDGRVVWESGYGLANKEEALPVAPETVFRAASISKVLAAWGVMHLVEKGMLSLDTAIESYLSRWHLPPSMFDHDAVTIRRLLGHTAGLSLSYIAPFSFDEELPTLEEALSGPNRGYGDVRVIAEPGSIHQYSGGGYMVLQLIVEEVTGERFEDYMAREVLNPLGMLDSTFEQTPAEGTVAAVGYDASGRPVPYYRYTGTAAAGLHSTASDLARFVAASMPGPAGELPGRGVLDPDTLELMLSPVMNTEESGIARGLSYLIDNRSGMTVAGHSGSDYGWNAKFLLLPDLGKGIVILTNSDGGTGLHVEVGCSWTAWATQKSVRAVCP